VSARPPAALEPLPRGEIFRIAGSVTLFCALGALILGVVYVATHRYEEASQNRSEHDAVASLLDLRPGADVEEIHQFLDAKRGAVIYRFDTKPGLRSATELSFSLDGRFQGLMLEESGFRLPKSYEPLGRMFVAFDGARPLGYVIEGETRGYKNPIRFFVALDASFGVAGVRVVQHEEDPGLGAEVATPWFQGQYMGRSAAEMETLQVTRDPMPEDWRAALGKLERETPLSWRTNVDNGTLMNRERGKPIYAVTGATISSRALTEGVRATVRHFRHRFELLSPHLAEVRAARGST